ncbi:MAG: DUF4058 family protein [Chloroflexales bacterium]|nr:DUF4058 family protein [Chloroflexales bacterium]
MPTPFPGVDPYLERPSLWPDVHNRLLVLLAEQLTPVLRPRYYAAIEERTYLVEPAELVLVGRADVAVVEPMQQALVEHAQQPHHALSTVEVPMPDEVVETFLEVREVGSGRVITLVEVLSPSNKRPGDGRDQYERKRLRVLGSQTHLVEIDLLRGGPPLPLRGAIAASHYRILVSRADQRPRAALLSWSVRVKSPPFVLPLQSGDAEPSIDATGLLHGLYDRAGYDLRIDYREEPEPPLAGEDAAWADALLRAAGLRS